MTVDAAILALVVAFLLPLRLLTLALRLFVSGRGASAGDLRRSFAALALTAALLAAIFALPRDRARECAAPAGVADGGRDELRAEVEQLKLQLAGLVLDDKSDALKKDGRVMRALGLDIQSLFDVQENIKESLRNSYYDNIRAMENEVHILKDESRKMNSDIYNVHSLAKDTTERVEALHTDIKKVQAITDEWGKMNSNINRIWSFAKDTEKRVEDLYSDIKKQDLGQSRTETSPRVKLTKTRKQSCFGAICTNSLRTGFQANKEKDAVLDRLMTMAWT